MADWRLQVYRVSDATAQELVAALLAGMDTLVVEAVSSDFDHFVVIESDGHSQAEGVARLLRSIDPGVRLIHTSTAPTSEPSTEPTAA